MKIHVSHILVEQKYEGEDLQRKIAEGVSFEDLAKKFSKCPSGKSGGDLGVVDSARFVPEFAEVAEGLKGGEISGLVKTRFGYHLIKKLDLKTF
ncbi:MAG: peptidylprolyl isomerase [Pseudobdellovibrionaceae bacterium]